MKCNQVQPNLSDYSLGRLTREESRRLSEHLEQCDACRVVLAEEQALAAMLTAAPSITPKRDVWSIVESRIHAEPQRRSWFGSGWIVLKIRTSVAIGAAALVLLAGGTISVDHYRSTKAEEQRVKEAIALMRVQTADSNVQPVSTSDAMMNVLKEQVPSDDL